MAGSLSAGTAQGGEAKVGPRFERYLRGLRPGEDSATGGPVSVRGWRALAPRPRGHGDELSTESVVCDICGPGDVEAVGVGEDFEYWTSPDSFLVVRCSTCGLVFLDPRPTEAELERIYPTDYHAFDFSEERFGLVHDVRSRLEARRVLRSARDLPADALIVDVGCGDGFHLDLLRRFGEPGWTLQGVEPDARAADVATGRGIHVHQTTLGDAEIEPGSVDLVLLIQTIEHVPDPSDLLREIRSVLKPTGRLLVVTDNVGSPDFRIFRSRHWGGYHFPRHWHLYDRSTLTATARNAGFEVENMSTILSPVNWTYSLRNLLVDLDAPERVVRPLSLNGAAALAVGTAIDAPLALFGRGALLRGEFRPSAPR